MAGRNKTRKKSTKDGASEAEADVTMTCPTCESDVTSDQSVLAGRGIQCETCDKWYHSGCLGWSVEQYKFVADNECLHFCCNGCDAISNNNSKMSKINKIEAKVDKITKTLQQSLGLGDNLEEPDANTEPSEHVANRTSYAKAVMKGNSIQAKIIRHITSVSNEERMRRCLVFSGMVENGQDLSDATALCQKLDPSSTVCETFRMGTINRSDSNEGPRGPRILKVVFPSSSVAKSILMEAKSLSKDKEYGSVFIRKSMSYEERQKLFHLRQRRDGLNRAENGAATRIHYAVVKNEIKRFINCQLGDNDRLVNGTLDTDWTAPPPPPLPTMSKNGSGGRNSGSKKK